MSVGVLLLCLTPLSLFVLAPFEFPTDAHVNVEEGLPASTIGERLYQKKLISSPLLFTITVRMFGLGKHIQSGTYRFERPIGLTELLYRITHGVSGFELTRVTIPEGYSMREMAETYKEVLPLFDSERFLARTVSEEGLLFPDTYLFSESATDEEVVLRMKENFYNKVHLIQNEIDAFGVPLLDVVTMASIVELEARTTDERQMIADILWRRLADDYPLQVDAVFGYIQGTDIYHPSFDDLEIESPYNTYRNRGLPPTPIASPGLEALRATVTPTPNEYWYYLTGTDGVIRYAKTFEEHKKNRELYLD
jgi:UPF0755 protein